MKPIEIHIEGYKIVIAEDDRKADGTSGYIEPIDKETLPTHPFIPCVPHAWWEHPYVTWTGGEVSTTNTTKPDFHLVRDTMVGKTTEDVKEQHQD